MARVGNCATILVSFWLALAAATPARAADAAFQKWLEDLWPQAQALGVSRPTFDAATRGLEPDLTHGCLNLFNCAPFPDAARRVEPVVAALASAVGRAPASA